MRRIRVLILLAAGVPSSAFASVPPEDVERLLSRAQKFDVTEDVEYCSVEGQKLYLDVYQPRGEKDLKPAALILHGGGWNGRDKSHPNFKDMSAAFASRGFVVFNINYRLAKDAPAPAAVQDAHCAARYIHTHAQKYQVDVSRIIATGNSAGCHLALMLALCDSKECQGKGSWQGSSNRLRAVVNRFAITDVVARAFGEKPRKSALRWLEKGQGDLKDLARRMSPLEYTGRKNAPAIFTIHGEVDSNTPVSDGIRLHEQLVAAGNDSQLFVVPGGNHGLHNLSKKAEADLERRIFDFLIRQSVL